MPGITAKKNMADRDSRRSPAPFTMSSLIEDRGLALARLNGRRFSFFSVSGPVIHRICASHYISL